jgi:hypothetical protein
MEEIYKKLDDLKEGLTHSKSKNRFYNNFVPTLGKYPTLALLGLNSRSNVSMAEIEMIASMAELYIPISLKSYNVDINGLPNVAFNGVSGEYRIRFDMQFKIIKSETNSHIFPDLKLTIVQYSKTIENDITSIAIEYEGHSSHTDPKNVKAAFSRNREISYKIGGPVLPFYQDDLKSKAKRQITLSTLKTFIHKMISGFECAAEFARKVHNSKSIYKSIYVTCPVCEGTETLGGDFCPGCSGNGKIKRTELQLINVEQYSTINCHDCKCKGCINCNYSGYLPREKAIQNSLSKKT